MSEYRTFRSGEILSDSERRNLSPEDQKRYKTEQRIRAAMAIAANDGATDDERAQATRTISKLIALHEIDVAAFMDKSEAKKPVKIVHFKFEVSNRYSLGSQRAYALNAGVISPLGGKLIYSDSRSAKYPVVCTIFLPEDVVDFAKALMASLMLQVETTLKVASVAHQRELRGQWLSKSQETGLMLQFRRGYLRSWGHTVGRRMAEGREDARQEASASTGTEIALRDTSKLAEAALEAMYPKLRKARAVLVSDTGRTAGARDGRRANLGNNALTSR